MREGLHRPRLVFGISATGLTTGGEIRGDISEVRMRGKGVRDVGHLTGRTEQILMMLSFSSDPLAIIRELAKNAFGCPRTPGD